MDDKEIKEYVRKRIIIENRRNSYKMMQEIDENVSEKIHLLLKLDNARKNQSWKQKFKAWWKKDFFRKLAYFLTLRGAVFLFLSLSGTLTIVDLAFIEDPLWQSIFEFIVEFLFVFV